MVRSATSMCPIVGAGSPLRSRRSASFWTRRGLGAPGGRPAAFTPASSTVQTAAGTGPPSTIPASAWLRMAITTTPGLTVRWMAVGRRLEAAQPAAARAAATASWPGPQKPTRTGFGPKVAEGQPGEALANPDEPLVADIDDAVALGNDAKQHRPRQVVGLVGGHRDTIVPQRRRSFLWPTG